ncbi:MAG: HAMP domain-containing protein [Desulfobacula sp.]|nr:HAMP domain-containing protein [Desulfobacula sp.]
MMKLTIYNKMMMGFSAIITIMIVSSAYVLFELNTVANGAKVILTSNVRIQELARLLQAIIQDENGYAGKYLVSNDETYFSLFVETSKQVDQNLNLLLEKQSSPEDQSLIYEMQKAHDALVAHMQKKNHQTPETNATRKQIRQKYIAILLDSLDILISRNHSSIEKKMVGIESITARSVQVALLLVAVTLFAAITAALIITRTITRPIGDLIKGTEHIARGKFEKILVSSHYEIALLADAVNDMSAKINDVNELRTQMMQQISHELKTPLQAMQSAHDVLKISNSVKDSQIRMLDVFDRGIDKIATFSRQYFDFSKIESGVMQYNMELSDLPEIVEPVVDEAKLIAASKDINLELDFDAVPRVMVDPEKISIIISNLISNAIKYTPNDGKVVVSIGPCDLGVQVKVQDSGIGINPDEISNIFTRFYQASNIKKIACSGSGVGLAIVKAYTEGHGGKIYVESSPDQGSLFKVEFPILNDQPFKAVEAPLSLNKND